ncbi:hypothetical protein Plim_2991 [Planctopirus limnophila DSM 3776]|uniref:Uncharacterized protein n=1 Tax=Planctopirus limnophila (strain ATCC 43296 / DSM 3776 / IFAM 1008 / Mu 290) TaxID=521674 RepID=D5SS89_PLAL2|nr:hypothetical protein [Planctopirus limnophila]ADG68813.1 hypothetical protein Plim_2991 [Planctopirus limnophila DSM 3776]
MSHFKYRTLFVIPAALLTGLLAMTSADQSQSPTSASLNVSDITNRRVTLVGVSGVELGQCFELTGRIAIGNKAAKGIEQSSFLVIETINGEPVTGIRYFAADQISFRDRTNRFEESPLPPVGTQVHLAAYETGNFIGSPQGDIYRPPVQDRGFHFRSQLVVCHDFRSASK